MHVSGQRQEGGQKSNGHTEKTLTQKDIVSFSLQKDIRLPNSTLGPG